MRELPLSSATHIPGREELLAELITANRWGWSWLVAQLLSVLLLIPLIDWNRVLQQPLISTVAIAVIIGPFAMSILKFWAQQKKEIGDLKEQTRFGQYDKHQLRQLFQETLRRLKLPEKPLPVYIVANKFINASMLHLGLGAVFQSLNGIYLHRQTLHKLTPEEVQDIMGHELGHYYFYYLINDRFRGVTLLFGSMTGIFAVQWFDLNSYFSSIALMLVAGTLWKVSGLLLARHIWAIEYLCDDLGAQVHGVAVSVSGLMKLGAEQEVLTALQLQAASLVRRGQLSAHEVAKAIGEAVPYGHVSQEELAATVQKSLARQVAQGPSLAGFLRYVWHSDADSEMDREFELQVQQLAALRSIPRIPWEKLLAVQGEIRFSEQSLDALVELIERFPEAVLFHTLDAIQADPTHPPLKQRILFLCGNRKSDQTTF